MSPIDTRRDVDQDMRWPVGCLRARSVTPDGRDGGRVSASTALAVAWYFSTPSVSQKPQSGSAIYQSANQLPLSAPCLASSSGRRRARLLMSSNSRRTIPWRRCGVPTRRPGARPVWAGKPPGLDRQGLAAQEAPGEGKGGLPTAFASGHEAAIRRWCRERCQQRRPYWWARELCNIGAFAEITGFGDSWRCCQSLHCPSLG